MPLHSLSQELSQSHEALPPFEHLYDRYHVQVYRYLYAHVRNEQDAADLLQQVFLQVWNHRQTYDPGRGTVATWLFGIAHHRLVDFSRLSRPSLSWESVPETAAADQNPETSVLEEETIAQVRKILEALPQSERELLALRFAARLSSGEIALLIGKSEAATKKQLTRLLHRLQEQYRRDILDELLPDLLEPALPAFPTALLQAYAVVLPTIRFRDIHEDLLKRIHPVSL